MASTDVPLLGSTSRLSHGSAAPSRASRASFASAKVSKKSKAVPSIDLLLGQIGLGGYSAVLIVTLSLAQMSQSLNTNLLAYLMPCAGASLQASAGSYGLLGTSFNTASYFATPAFGAIADSIGRKPAVILSVLIMTIAGGGASTSQSWLALCLWMALMGVGLGGCMVPFDLLSELSPPDNRGAILNATNWFWSAGTVLVCVLAWLTVGDLVPGLLPSTWEPWRVMVLAVVTPVVASLVLTPVLVESPHWLVEQGRHAEAMGVLESLARLNGQPAAVLDDHLRSSLLSSARPTIASGIARGSSIASSGRPTAASAADDVGALTPARGSSYSEVGSLGASLLGSPLRR